MIKHIKLPYETEIPHRIRYVQNRVGYNTANDAAHWVKIQIFDKNGVNIAPNGVATWIPGGTVTAGGSGSSLTTVISADAPVQDQWLTQQPSTGIQVDLGAIYEVDHIVIFHYWVDGRKYFNHSTLVSADGNVWYEVMTPEPYTETSSGKTITW